MAEGIMVELWRDFWIRETGTGQQVTQLHERRMMMKMMTIMMTCNVYEDPSNFMITSPSVLCRLRSVSDESCREDETHILSCVYWTVHRCDSWRTKDQRDVTILFHFLCAQHVSDINISIIRSLRLFCWITTRIPLKPNHTETPIHIEPRRIRPMW